MLKHKFFRNMLTKIQKNLSQLKSVAFKFMENGGFHTI